MKYEFTGEEMEFSGRKLKRIRRISDGLVGGWIETEANLSQEGTCFVYDEAKVYDSAVVSGSAQIYGSARIFDSAVVYGSALVYGFSAVFGSARIFDSAVVYGFSAVFESAVVYGFSAVFDSAVVYGFSAVFDSAVVYGFSAVFDSAVVYGSAQVHSFVHIRGESKISKTSDYIFLNLKYPITITKTHMSIGCEYKTHEEWNALKFEEQSVFTLEEFKDLKTSLSSLFNLVGKF